jgi:adenylate cyclase
MGIEIERKFLLKNDSWRDHFTKKMELRQGYFSTSDDCTVRIRISDNEAWLTIKGKTRNISRSEFEYLIPKEDAESMLLELAAEDIVEKVRYFIDCEGSEWVVDEFHGRNRGLVVAEIELSSEDVICEKPEWIGKEVSSDYRYSNSNLSKKPYSRWKK